MGEVAQLQILFVPEAVCVLAATRVVTAFSVVPTVDIANPDVPGRLGQIWIGCRESPRRPA